MPILNLTRYPATPSQRKAGVIDLADIDTDYLETLYERLFNRPQDARDVSNAMVDLALGADESGGVNPDVGELVVLIGGPPWFMRTLEPALGRAGIRAVYATCMPDSVSLLVPGSRNTEIMRMNNSDYDAYIIDL